VLQDVPIVQCLRADELELEIAGCVEHRAESFQIVVFEAWIEAADGDPARDVRGELRAIECAHLAVRHGSPDDFAVEVREQQACGERRVFRCLFDSGARRENRRRADFGSGDTVERCRECFVGNCDRIDRRRQAVRGFGDEPAKDVGTSNQIAGGQ
jgi:hypothetical protein